MPLLWLLSGCCPSFDEIEVVEGEGAEGAAAIVSAAIAEFASWTSREGVCVADVTVEPIVDDAFLAEDGAAHGQARGRHIWIDPAADLELVTRHELCHAWDRVEGRPSRDLPELFPPAEAPDFELYADQNLAAQEVFAEECARGPRALDELNELFSHLCGDGSAVDPTDAWLRENVFDRYVEAVDVPLATAPFDLERVALDAHPDNTADAAVVSGDGLVVLEGVVVNGTRTSFDLLYIDPSTGEAARRAAPIPAGASYYGLLGSDGAPIAWTRRGEELLAWRVPLEGDPEPVTLPNAPDLVGLGGYAWGDELLVTVATPTTTTLLRADLATGESSPVALPDDVDGTAHGLAGSGGERIVVNTNGVVLVYSLASDAWVGRLEGPGWTFEDIAELPDGRFVARVPRGTSGGVSLPVVVDPERGVWTFPEAGCAEADGGVYGRLFVVEGSARLLARGEWTEPFRELILLTP